MNLPVLVALVTLAFAVALLGWAVWRRHRYAGRHRAADQDRENRRVVDMLRSIHVQPSPLLARTRWVPDTRTIGGRQWARAMAGAR